MARNTQQAGNCRSRYTKEAIKSTLLDMMQKTSFDRISVTQICQRLDISRSTFYLHYYDTYDVLDDLIREVLEDTTGVIDHVLFPSCTNCTQSLCQQFQRNPRLRPLLLDETASRRILENVSREHRAAFTAYILKNTRLTREQADALFYFQISGCLVTNRMMLEANRETWPEIQRVIDQYIRGGLESHLAVCR